jgi:AhpD family alkylhydroperoxidase
MYNDWKEHTKLLGPSLKEMRAAGGLGEVMKAFTSISQAALKSNALDTKTKELIAVAISVALRCDDCIAFHVKAALDRGATRDEIMESLGMAIYMGAGPSVMYASHVVEAMDQLMPKVAVD